MNNKKKAVVRFLFLKKTYIFHLFTNIPKRFFPYSWRIKLSSYFIAVIEEKRSNRSTENWSALFEEGPLYG